jgi:PPOX class probable F420-dependent enzyme
MTSWNDVRPYFDRAAVCHLATLQPDGAPYSVPVWVGVEGDHLAVFMEEGSRKDANLQRDPRVALSITDPAEPLSMAEVRGRAISRLTGPPAQEIVDRIAVKYTGERYFQRDGMTAFLVEPERMSARDYSAD